MILEDNICFFNSVKTALSRYLLELPKSWGLLFDSDIANLHYIEGPVEKGKSVYLKSNERTYQCLGSSRGANFILLNYETAKILYDNFLPFNNVTDLYYNHLLKKFNINTYWAEPPNVHKIPRPSTWKEEDLAESRSKLMKNFKSKLRLFLNKIIIN